MPVDLQSGSATAVSTLGVTTRSATLLRGTTSSAAFVRPRSIASNSRYSRVTAVLGPDALGVVIDRVGKHLSSEAYEGG
jgi:hypothetical protein